LIVNADRFLIVSGQRNYFYEQKDYYLEEIPRLRGLYEKNKLKKNEYKRNCKDIQSNMDNLVERLENDIMFLREKVTFISFNLLINYKVKLRKTRC
jgi:hypothetical protein